ncbi:DedA family protein [Candidatus Falkowbacteria bacterium HGW-Falkowbacteria-2]|uniref:DedA family protein n=1 Tax=Candidatus Falkowbacteria bacterium HGW-Falkowbacteria-2 TaxID=2013769 RepID=A0A2N2DYZ5_9BACT|nr:MAG: DedA family protein [Candidatus Falkowbacteria bacterium HGW-Falkowbacteria-2]
MLITFVDALLAFAQEIGYWGVVFLMAIESSFIPFPSELVVPPAAYLAAQGTLNIWLVIGASVLGSLIGAIFNYFLAYYLGRPLIYRLASSKFARFLLIKPEQITRAELYFAKYDSASTFFGRLIPVIRQLISLPAGFVRMPLFKFIFYTFLGSLLWTLVLAGLGYFFGANEELWKTYYAEISWGIIGLAAIILALFIWKQRKKSIIK